MNRIQIVSAACAITAAACAVFYVSRGNRLTDTEAAVIEKRAAIERLEASPPLPGRSFAQRDGRLPDPAPGRLSVADTAANAVSIGASFGQGKPVATDYLKAMSELLGQIEDFTIQEVLALADAIDAPTTGGDLGMTGRMKQGLLLLVAEHDPEALLARPETTQDTQLNATALAALAKRDSAAALRWLDGAVDSLSHSNEPEKMVRHVVRSVFRADFRQGLHLAGELGVGGESLGALGITLPLRREVVEQAAEVLAGEQNTAQRTAILDMILTSTAFYSGIEGVRDISARHGIPDADIAAFLTSSAGRRSLEGTDPSQAIPWMDTVLNEEQRKSSVPALVKAWAKRDFNAAGTYLGEMPPSETKDLAVADFATIVVSLDPMVAAVWALEISDPGHRQTTLGGVVEKWRGTDARAAEAWLQENGLADTEF